MRVAAIGIGSNSLRMLIADVERGRLFRLDRYREGLRVFAALDRQGNITPEMTGKACRSVEAFRRRGARMIALTWKHENAIASPAKDGSQAGIKPFGWQVLAEMARLGMAADTSHLNERGFWDLIERHSQPPMASHSCCAALHPHFRNLTDAQIRALIERGGWIGVNFYPAFLTGGEATVADIVRHIDHIAQLGGAAYVGFGSDFDGIERTPLDCTGPQDVPRILDALRALGYPEETVRGIAGENFIAYFERLEA